MIATIATEPKKDAREDLEQTVTYCILVYFSSQRWLQSLESGFLMIATIAQGPREGWAEGAFALPLFGAIKKQK